MAGEAGKAIEKRNWDYIDGLGNDIAKYVSFLSVMARFHRYPVEDLPSFALEAPESFTAVASSDFWANKYRRTLKSNARGVTLVRNGQEAFYYDVSETDAAKDSQTPALWQYKEEEHSKYINAAVPGSENTETKIRILAENIVSKSFVKDVDKALVSLSAASVALERMGVPCEETHRRIAVMSMQDHDVRSVLMNTYTTARGILDAVEKSVSFEANRNVNEAANNPLIQSFGVIDRGMSIEEAIHEEMSQPGMFLGFEDEYSTEEEMEQMPTPSESDIQGLSSETEKNEIISPEPDDEPENPAPSEQSGEQSEQEPNDAARKSIEEGAVSDDDSDLQDSGNVADEDDKLQTAESADETSGETDEPEKTTAQDGTEEAKPEERIENPSDDDEGSQSEHQDAEEDNPGILNINAGNSIAENEEEAYKRSYDRMQKALDDFENGKISAIQAKDELNAAYMQYIDGAFVKKRQNRIALMDIRDSFKDNDIELSDTSEETMKESETDADEDSFGTTEKPDEDADSQGLFDESEGALEEGNLFANTVEEAVKGDASDKEGAGKHKIEDFGEKIGGARKDIYSAYREMMSSAGREDMKSAPLSKSWPAPKYEKLLESGMEPWRVSAIHALRDIIAPKPPSRGWSLKVASWAIKAELYRSIAVRVVEGTLDFDQVCTVIDRADTFSYDESTFVDEDDRRAHDEWRHVTDFRNRVTLYEELGNNRNLNDLKFEYRRREFKTSPSIPARSYVLRKKISKYDNPVVAFGSTKLEAIEEYKKILEREDELKTQRAEEGTKKKKPINFGVWKWTNNKNYVFIGYKIGKDYIEVQSPFETYDDANKYLIEHQEELETKLASMKEIPFERNEQNEPRTGSAHRDGDITPEKFTETFGFRGVEFGNWVENKRRQEDLNQAYDALMDLSSALNLPPRAMSLCGTLGLAFGARGSGGKNAPLAHYEPAKTVINLTKKKGAGSLGHEWFHALDNYFAKSGGYSDLAMMTQGCSSTKINRQDVVDGFSNIINAIKFKTQVYKRSRELDKVRSKEYWTLPEEMAARSFEAYLKDKLAKSGIRNDYLVNIRDASSWKAITDSSNPYVHDNYPYPMGQDEYEVIRDTFDNLFSNIKTQMKGEDVFLYSASSSDTEEMLAQCVSVDYSNLTSEQRAMKMFSEEVLGVQMVFFDGPMELHGRFNKDTDTIFANRKGETSLEWTFWHEAFHAMRKNEPQLYEDLLRHTEKAETFSKEQMDEYRKSVNQPDMPDRTVREEMLADAFADIKTGRKIVEKMATENRSLTQRFFAFTKRIVESAKKLFSAKGEEKSQLEEKYPNAGLSEAQFESFASRIDDIKKDIRDAYGQPLADSKGYRIIESDMPRNMVMSQFAVSPYKYQPEKQRNFDLKAAVKLLKEYSADKVESAIRKLSEQKGPKYAEQIMSSVNSYAR